MFFAKNKRPRIALIADEFTTLGLSADADLIHVTPSDWQWKLRLFKPDFLFVESAWRGYKNSWQGKIASYKHKPSTKHELRKLLDFCRNKKITSIFWNKEDPFHFERFCDAAILFDAIYTTDAGSLQKYQLLPDYSHQFLGVLMFAAQPRWFQSETCIARSPAVAFMGGYYGNELVERSRLQEDILYSVRNHGLIIFDRYWKEHHGCSYPENLKDFCRPAVSHMQIADAYSKYQIYLNFNTISHSPTMLSRRVFEMSAAGCSIISTPSIAMNNIFGDNIAVVADGYEARERCIELQRDAKKRKEMGGRVKDIVLAQHTWLHRLEQINSQLGLY